jgi:hypothetical protein
MPDPIGAVIGLASIWIMVMLYRHCEALENGNIEKECKDATPSAEPRTDDMRSMVEDLGPQQVPIAYRIKSPLFGDMVVVVNPVHMKGKT